MTNPVLTIHRAANEIGGNCIELAHEGTRILLDAGAPLQGGPNAPFIPPSLDLTTPVDGLVLSHPHQDHFGLLPSLPESWPVWMGEGTEILTEMTLALRGQQVPQHIHRYRDRQPFTVGPFTITPWLTDHSAFDAHMLEIEVGGKRLVYSGDFRKTGRKSGLVERFIRALLRPVDVLLMEGTCLGRSGDFPTESELEDVFADHMRQTKGRVFVSWSGQNIDRTVTLYRACVKAQRELILDVYSLDVLARLTATGAKLPTLMDYQSLRGVVTRSMIRLYKNPDRFNRPEFVDEVATSGKAFGAAKLESLEKPAAIMLRPSLLRDFEDKGMVLTKDDCWLFSQWSGYKATPEYQKVEQAFAAVGATMGQVHTSGHASLDDLVDFSESLAPARMIPIHSDVWDQHLHRFSNVHRLMDNVPLTL